MVEKCISNECLFSELIQELREELLWLLGIIIGTILNVVIFSW